jgi:hypothetical protein
MEMFDCGFSEGGIVGYPPPSTYSADVVAEIVLAARNKSQAYDRLLGEFATLAADYKSLLAEVLALRKKNQIIYEGLEDNAWVENLPAQV